MHICHFSLSLRTIISVCKETNLYIIKIMTRYLKFIILSVFAVSIANITFAFKSALLMPCP
jgi:hypothetical protein